VLILKTIVDKIEALTQESGFIYTLALILMRDLFMRPEDIADTNPREHLNIQELTFLAGLLSKHPINFIVPTENESSNRFEATYQLFEELHNKYNESFLDQLAHMVKAPRQAETPEQNYRRVFGRGLTVAEAIFYSATGAYDFQYLEFAADKYRNDAVWIANHIGLSIDDMSMIARELKALHERKFNDLTSRRPREFSEMCTSALSVFCFDENDLQRFAPGMVRSFLKTFSLVPGSVNAKLQLPGQFNEFQPAPATLTGCCASITPQAHAPKPKPFERLSHNCHGVFSRSFPKQRSLSTYWASRMCR